MIRHEYWGTIRPYTDSDVEVPVYWYRAKPGAAQMPFPVVFADAIYSPRDFVPEVGMTYSWDPANLGNFGGYLGVRPCGTAEQWRHGVSIDDPADCDCEREAVVPVQEIPEGTVDGDNRVFTLTFQPISAASVLVFIDGVEQLQGSDYAVNNQTLTFAAGSTPRSGDTINVQYWRYT